MLRRLTFITALAAVLAGPAFAQGAPEKASINLGVGGKPLLYYLPLTVAERKGFFKEQGLDVAINDFGGGAKSLQALVGGSVDVVTGAYEHTIRMQVKGQDIVAVAELGRGTGRAPSKGEALRRAMVHLLAAARTEAEAHPQTWAPFVVIGETGGSVTARVSRRPPPGVPVGPKSASGPGSQWVGEAFGAC